MRSMRHREHGDLRFHFDGEGQSEDAGSRVVEEFARNVFAQRSCCIPIADTASLLLNSRGL